MKSVLAGVQKILPKVLLLILFVCLTVEHAHARTGMRESTLIVKKDYGYIRYAEDFYRLYSLPMYYNESDLFENLYYLTLALEAPFDFVNRALTIIETEKQYQKYKDLMHMQFNYLITQNYVYLGALYDKQNYYFYNDQFKEDITNSYEYAKYYYDLADKQWRETITFANKVLRNKSKVDMPHLIDKAYKISKGEINYSKTVTKRINVINKTLKEIE